MRFITSLVFGLIFLTSSLAASQPGIGISKTPPLVGNGTISSPLKIDGTGCSTNNHLGWSGSLWACSSTFGAINATTYTYPTSPITSLTDNLDPGADTTTLVLNCQGVYISGLTGGTSGRRIRIHNIATASNHRCYLPDDGNAQAVGSTATNRFEMKWMSSGTGVIDNWYYSIGPRGSVDVEYNTTINRWEIVGELGTFGGIDVYSGTINYLSAAQISTGGLLLGNTTEAPPATSGTVNNWAPTLYNSTRHLITPTGNLIITGISTGGLNTDLHCFANENGSGYTVEFPHESGSSSAANRFITANGNSIFIKDNRQVCFHYDSVALRWKVFAQTDGIVYAPPSGAGTQDFLTKWNATGDGLVNSAASDDGSNSFTIQDRYLYLSRSAGTPALLSFKQSGQTEWQLYQPGSGNNLNIWNSTLSADITYWDSAGLLTHTRQMTLLNGTQLTERLRLAGQEFYQAANTSTDGPTFLLGVNRGGNRQVWLADSATLTQNSTNVVLRLGTGNSLGATVDALATDGITAKPLVVAGSSVSISANPVKVGQAFNVYNNTINGLPDADADGQNIAHNYYGYSPGGVPGLTRDRDFSIYDGKGGNICYWTGATHGMSCSGAITTTGTITDARDFYLTRSIPDTVDDYVEIGKWVLANSGHSLDVTISTAQTAGFSVGKRYLIEHFYNEGGDGNWVIVKPIASTGRYSNNDFQLEAKQVNAEQAVYFRLRRTLNGNPINGATATIRMANLGVLGTWTAMSGTGSGGAPTAYYTSTPISVETDGTFPKIEIGNSNGGSQNIVDIRGQTIIYGSSYSSIFNYYGDASQPIYIRAGTASGFINIGDVNTGGVVVGNTTNHLYAAGRTAIGTTATPQGKLVVKSTNINSNPPGTGGWDSAWSVFGPNVDSANGASLGLGYDTSNDVSQIVSLAPGVAWKPMWFGAGGYKWFNGGVELARLNNGFSVFASPTIYNDSISIGFSAPNGTIASKNSTGSPASNLYFQTTDTGGTTSNVLALQYNKQSIFSGGLDITMGRSSGGGAVGTNDIAIQFGSGGYRHFISTQHNSAADTGNQIRFWLNTSVNSGDSTAPGTGNTNVMSLRGDESVDIGNGDMQLNTPGVGDVGVGMANDYYYTLLVNDTDGQQLLDFRNSSASTVVYLVNDIGESTRRASLSVEGYVNVISGDSPGGYKIDGGNALVRNTGDGHLYLTNPYNTNPTGTYSIILSPSSTLGGVNLRSGGLDRLTAYTDYVTVNSTVGTDLNTPYTFFGDTDAGAGADAYFANGILNFGFNDNSLFTGNINLNGYGGGNAQNRDLAFGDGRGNHIVTLQGSTGNVLVRPPSGGATAAAQFQVGTFVADPGSYSLSAWGGTPSEKIPVYIKTEDTNGGSSPTATQPALVLAREGVSGQAYANFAEFKLGRYYHTSSGAEARTRMDIALTGGTNEAVGEDIVSYFARGEVSIGSVNTVSSTDWMHYTQSYGLFNATGGLSHGQGSDSATTIISGKTRRNWVEYTDNLGNDGEAAEYDDGWYKVEYGSTITSAEVWTIGPNNLRVPVRSLVCSASSCSADLRTTITYTSSNVKDLRGRTVTASTWIKAPSGTAPFFITLGRYNDNNQITVASCTATTTWSRCVGTGTFNTTSYTDNSELRVYINLSNTTVYAHGFQLEEGSQATPYQRNEYTFLTDLGGIDVEAEGLDGGGFAIADIHADIKVMARQDGAPGNNYSIQFIADGTGTGSYTDGTQAVFHYQTGVTTVKNYCDAVDTAASPYQVCAVAPYSTGTISSKISAGTYTFAGAGDAQYTWSQRAAFGGNSQDPLVVMSPIGSGVNVCGIPYKAVSVAVTIGKSEWGTVNAPLQGLITCGGTYDASQSYGGDYRQGEGEGSFNGALAVRGVSSFIGSTTFENDGGNMASLIVNDAAYIASLTLGGFANGSAPDYIRQGSFIPTTVGWYRIIDVAAGAHASGVIKIHGLYDNKYTDVEFHYTVNGWGATGSINETLYSKYNDGFVDQVRISSNSGNGDIHLDIHISSATTPGTVYLYGYGPAMPAFVASDDIVVGATADASDVQTLTLGDGFRTTKDLDVGGVATIAGPLFGGTAGGSFYIKPSSASNGNLVLAARDVGNGVYLNYGGTASNAGVHIYDGGSSTEIGQIASNGNVQFDGTATIDGNEIFLGNGTLNQIRWLNVGVGAPTFTSRSAGTKLVLYQQVDGSNADYAIGIESGTQWYSVPQATSSYYFKWYGGTTNLMTLRGDGLLGILAFTNSQISPSSVSGTLNDWAPTGGSTASTIRVTQSNSTTITGLSIGQTAGRRVKICPLSGYPITFSHENGSSTAANRFTLPNVTAWNTGASSGNGCPEFEYDGTDSRWRMVSWPDYVFPFMVSGAGIFTSTLRVDGDISDNNGDVTVADGFHVTGAVDLDSTVNVDGAATIYQLNGYTTVLKTADQDDTDTTLSDDTDLQFATTAGKAYMIEASLLLGANGTGVDAKFTLIPAAGTIDGRGTFESLSTTDASQFSGYNFTGAATAGTVTVGTHASTEVAMPVTIKIVVKTSNTTTLKVQFAANAAGTARMHKGSYLRYKLLN